MEEKLSTQQFLERATCSNPGLAKLLQNVSFHHIDSFNYIYDHGLKLICQYLPQIDIFSSEQIDNTKSTSHLPFKKMKIWFENLEIGYPMQQVSNLENKDNRLLPSECRIAGKTYGAPLLATFGRKIGDSQVEKFQQLYKNIFFRMNLGDIPIIVKSSHCHLNKLTPKELVKMNEDCNEFGGYFIINGNEKIIRMLILQKRNYPIAFIRPGFVNKGPNFSSVAVQSRCTREDLFSKTLTLHYVNDGNIILRILHRKQEFLIPLIVILKSMAEISDVQIYNRLVRGNSKSSNIHDKIEVLLRGGKALSLNSQEECLMYLGRNFRIVLNITNPEINDREVGQIFIKENMCVHLNDNMDKFNYLLLMTEKLYALINNEILPDNLDSLMNQEVLLPGHLYMMMLREKLEEILITIRFRVLKDGQKSKDAQRTQEISYLKRIIEQQVGISKKIDYLLSTGNLRSGTGLDLMQAKGYTIIADKLNNMRYFSHFRSIHRGSYFAEMKTTSVRKLLPENWGFLCPVHTPDGAPCGLLNHLAKQCFPLTRPCFDPDKHKNLEIVLTNLGMNPISKNINIIHPPNSMHILLDGKLIGYVETELIDGLIRSLKYLKVNQVPENLVPEKLEIGYIPKNYGTKSPSYPGIYLYTSEARFLRQVLHLKHNKQEWISPFEQVFLSIACTENEIRNDSEYQENCPSDILSILPSNIPFLNYNQSPRNMYQCQMAKQTMGTPLHNFPYRFDNRLYRLMTPQLPIVKGQKADDYGLMDYPSGTNAIVAVISYTGYDMEDAMILNKSSYERGFAHGVIYKNYSYNVCEIGKDNLNKSKFKLLTQEMNNPQLKIPEGLDIDGIPPIGSVLKKNQPVFSIYDTTRNTNKTVYFKEQEQGKLDGVSINYGDSKLPNDVQVQYRVRFTRNPIIGDKFSSRHGQKGVLGVLWPQIDMPFTEQGICPDVIINPHAFPSRMTIGMLLESMAGKTQALKGKIIESIPFQPFKDDDITKYFGEQLIKYGYNYQGNEIMYSGISGEKMKVDIFLGVVYYQRLRHMVSDKSQARSIGPVDVLTQQPIKGRKKGGGIRMGEMERDALLAHGVSLCIYDRFMVCSDKSEGLICTKCGSLLACINVEPFLNINEESTENFFLLNQKFSKSRVQCLNCKPNKSECVQVYMPFVLRYLTNELAAMNIKLSFRLK